MAFAPTPEKSDQRSVEYRTTSFRFSQNGSLARAGLSTRAHDPRVSITSVQRVSLVLHSSNASLASSDAGACCKLRLTIDKGTSSGEHKFKLLALLLAELLQRLGPLLPLVLALLVAI